MAGAQGERGRRVEASLGLSVWLLFCFQIPFFQGFVYLFVFGVVGFFLQTDYGYCILNPDNNNMNAPKICSACLLSFGCLGFMDLGK